jgi:hypothetical protein
VEEVLSSCMIGEPIIASSKKKSLELILVPSQPFNWHRDSHTVRDQSPVLNSKLRFSRREAARVLGMSQRTLDYRIKAGEIKTKRDGDRVYITAAELRGYSQRDHAGTKK